MNTTFEYTPVSWHGAETGVCADVTLWHGTVTLPCQTHTCNVAVIEADADTANLPPFSDTDALISLKKGLTIGVRTADCVPVLLYAPDIPAVAAIHAGWKGTLGGIVSNAVRILIERGANPRNILAAMGPCICAECYEVSPDLATRFARAGLTPAIHPASPSNTQPDTPSFLPHKPNPHLDLPQANRQLLISAGIPAANITMPRYCTLQTAALPSWRRNPGTTQRLLTHIRLT